jgi:hypothetical protein
MIQRLSLVALQLAVEATTLNERTFHLKPQDRFLRDNIQPNDVLIVSVGGNDVAMAPTPCTILSCPCCAYSTCRCHVSNKDVSMGPCHVTSTVVAVDRSPWDLVFVPFLLVLGT